MAGDEEEEILNWAETLNPSPTTPDKVQQLKKEILEHSKEMKILFSLMTKANHHRAALKESLRTNNFLKGLTVQIQPHILEPDPAVLAEWNTAHMDFTKTLIQTLIRHYDKLVRIETEKQDNKRKQMLENIKWTQLSTRDAEYLNRLWQEETATAFTDAKKYADEKAEQWQTTAERLKFKERNKPSTLKKPNRPPPKGGGAPKGIKQASREQSPHNVNSKWEAPQTTEEGDLEEEAKAKEAEAAETREPSEKTTKII